MTENKVNVYLLMIVAVVSIIALVTVYISMNRTGPILLPEEAVAGQAIAYPMENVPTDWRESPAASDQTITKFFFRGDIKSVQ